MWGTPRVTIDGDRVLNRAGSAPVDLRQRAVSIHKLRLLRNHEKWQRSVESEE